MTADRNLLLGILALQLDFIDRDQLIETMNAWVLDKSRTIESLLVEKGHLSSARCELLSGVVKEHLEQHGNDPQRSLRTLMPLGEEPDALGSQISDAEVGATFALVAADRREVEDPRQTLTHAVGESTSAGSRFRILRHHAQGGLGKVSVARDEELGREVALKEIQERYAANGASRDRFVMEAEVTGGLEHPGVVPVYGLGQFEDGRPFYAMRFIRGNSLQEAIDRFHDPHTKQQQDSTARSLELRSLIGRLIDVCNAIEYAHSRGVLHRDLKPDNVMLGNFGETLVVDWGLAKMVDRDDAQGSGSNEPTLNPDSSGGSAPTEMGSAIGTPAYMSPEQAAGRLDQLGPASDVYSLGATLYSLVTGSQPFESVATNNNLLHHVQQGDFVRPRQRDSGVSRTLEAICMKAMATDQADRYHSPGALADDLEHWLADEPVDAYQESLSQRLGRWERKHRSYVRAGGIALLLVASVSMAAAFGVNQARQQESAQRQRADKNAERERLAAEVAREAEREAQVNLTRALSAEAETVKALAVAEAEADSSQEVADFLVNLFLGSDPTGLGGGLASIDSRGSEMSAVRLLEHGASLLDDQVSANPQVRAQLMDTLGFIFTSYGDFSTAKPLLNEALALKREIYDENHPELAIALKNSGVFHFLTGDYSKARRYERAALAIREQEFGPDSGPTADMLFILGWHISAGYTNDTLLAESEQLLRRAVEIQERIYGPDDLRPIFSRLALAYTLLAQDRSADAMFLVVGATQQLAKTKGDSRPVEAITNMVSGLAAERSENWAQAIESMRNAQRLSREVLGPHHPIVNYFELPIVTYLERSGDVAAAEQSLRKLVENERRTFPDGAWVGYRLLDLGSFLVRQGSYEESTECFEEALEIFRTALGENSLMVGSTLNELALVAKEQDDVTSAQQLLREALAAYDSAIDDHPVTVAEWRAQASDNLAKIQKSEQDEKAGE